MSDNIFIRHKGEVKENLINLKKEVILGQGIERFAYSKEEKDNKSKAIYELTVENNENMYFTFLSNEGINIHAYIEDREINYEVNGLNNIVNFGKQEIRY